MDKDKEKIKAWLSKLAANKKEFIRLSDLRLDSGLYEICTGSGYSVQLYKCARKIAEILEIQFREEVYTVAGVKRLEVSFIYDGVTFFGLEDCDAGND